MSVDTNVKGKNLAPYRRVKLGDLRILVSPQLMGLAHRMKVDVSGGIRKKLAVELSDGTSPDNCSI